MAFDQTVRNKEVNITLYCIHAPRDAPYRVALCTEGVIEDVHNVRIIFGDENMKRGRHKGKCNQNVHVNHAPF